MCCEKQPWDPALFLCLLFLQKEGKKSLNSSGETFTCCVHDSSNEVQGCNGWGTKSYWSLILGDFQILLPRTNVFKRLRQRELMCESLRKRNAKIRLIAADRKTEAFSMPTVPSRGSGGTGTRFNLRVWGRRWCRKTSGCGSLWRSSTKGIN